MYVLDDIREANHVLKTRAVYTSDVASEKEEDQGRRHRYIKTSNNYWGPLKVMFDAKIWSLNLSLINVCYGICCVHFYLWRVHQRVLLPS